MRRNPSAKKLGTGRSCAATHSRIFSAVACFCAILIGTPSAISKHFLRELYPHAILASTNDFSQCATGLRDFVYELDHLLDGNLRGIDPVLALLKKHFPVKNCNIDEAIEICRQSKYFSSISENRSIRESHGVVVILFKSKTFYVQFGLGKESGDSNRPFAKIIL